MTGNSIQFYRSVGGAGAGLVKLIECQALRIRVNRQWDQDTTGDIEYRDADRGNRVTRREGVNLTVVGDFEVQVSRVSASRFLVPQDSAGVKIDFHDVVPGRVG